MSKGGSLKSTLAVSLNNYLDAGAIVAGASGVTLWQNYLGLSEMHLGWLNALSANALGAAIGAIIGGFLADRFGRKFIFTYNLLVYMTGVLIVMLAVNFPMLLAGFMITGISVGIGVPASWTYISESSEVNNRGRNICISQMSWGIGPMVILLRYRYYAHGCHPAVWYAVRARRLPVCTSRVTGLRCHGRRGVSGSCRGVQLTGGVLHAFRRGVHRLEPSAPVGGECRIHSQQGQGKE